MVAKYNKDLDKSIRTEKKKDIKKAKQEFQNDVGKIVSGVVRAYGLQEQNLKKMITKAGWRSETNWKKITGILSIRKKKFISLTEENVKLVDKRVKILYDRYKTKEKEANKDPEYIELGEKADKNRKSRRPSLEQKIEKQIDDLKAMLKSVVDQMKEIVKYKSELASNLC